MNDAKSPALPDSAGTSKSQQFRLRTLFALIAVAGILFAAIDTYRRIADERAAHGEYDRRVADREVDLAGPLPICESAETWMLAQRRLWWRNKVEDYGAYLERLRTLEEREHGLIPLTMYSSEEGWLDAERTAERITRWRLSAERSSE